MRKTLASRLLLAFLLVMAPGVAVLVTVTLRAIRSMVDVNQRFEEVSRSHQATWALHLTLEEATIPPREYLLGGAPPNPQEFERLIESAEQQLATCSTSTCHATTRRTPKEMALGLGPMVVRLRGEGRAILAAEVPDRVEAMGRVRELDRLFIEINETFTQMATALLSRVDALRLEAQAVIRQATLVLGAAVVAVIAAAWAVAILLARRISIPLRELVEGTRRIIQGDWGYQVVVKDSREIGEVATSFNAMMVELGRYRDDAERRVQAGTAELEQKEAALRRAERLASVGRLAAGVAHEINNPLTSILMNANLLMEEVGEGSPLYPELQKIDEDGARCQRIVEDLRELSTTRELQRSPCRVEEILAPALREATAEIASRGIEVAEVMAPGLPAFSADAGRMVQVLSNLLVNAAQAMDGGGRLTVTAARDPAGIVLRVRDTGAGIAPEHRARLFDPFFTTKPRGTGLGLSISYGIVRDHGGRIEVESRTRDEVPGEPPGTEVSVFLPLDEVIP